MVAEVMRDWLTKHVSGHASFYVGLVYEETRRNGKYSSVDERANYSGRGDAKCLGTQKGYDCSFQADHAADEGIDQDR